MKWWQITHGLTAVKKSAKFNSKYISYQQEQCLLFDTWNSNNGLAYPLKMALLMWLLVIDLERDWPLKRGVNQAPLNNNNNNNGIYIALIHRCSKYQFVLQEIFIMRGKKSIVVNSIWGLVKVEDRSSVKKTLWGMGAPLSFLQLL